MCKDKFFINMWDGESGWVQTANKLARAIDYSHMPLNDRDAFWEMHC